MADDFMQVKAALIRYALAHEMGEQSDPHAPGRVRAGLCIRMADGRIVCHVVFDQFATDPDQVVFTLMTASADGSGVAFFDDPPTYSRGSLQRMGDPLA